jgi:hypothetical protein
VAKKARSLKATITVEVRKVSNIAKLLMKT